MATTTWRLSSHPPKTLLIVGQGPAAPRAEGLTSEEHRSMGGDPKTPKDALLDPEESWISFLGTSGPVGRGSPRGRPPAASSSTVRTRSGAARAHTYNLVLARLVMELRLAPSGPSRLGLGCREHGRQLDGHLLRVAGMRFPRVNVGISAIEFVTWFDTTLIPLRTQYGATRSEAGKGNPFKYAAFAIPCKPLQRLNYHS
jgi:hypothetical protein